MSLNAQENLESQDWGPIMSKLYAHSIFRLKWFGIKSEAELRGMEYKDFAHEAVKLVYEGKRKWKSEEQPDILKYLKTVVNSLISNFMKSDKHKLVDSVDTNNEINDKILFEDMMQMKLVNGDLIEKIEETLLEDENMWLVFTDLALGMTPLDISEKYGMDIHLIRNAQRRLRRHIDNIKNL